MTVCFANGGDSDQLPHSAASDLSLHCLPKYHFYGIQSEKGKESIQFCIKKQQWDPIRTASAIISEHFSLRQI